MLLCRSWKREQIQNVVIISSLKQPLDQRKSHTKKACTFYRPLVQYKKVGFHKTVEARDLVAYFRGKRKECRIERLVVPAAGALASLQNLRLLGVDAPSNALPDRRGHDAGQLMLWDDASSNAAPESRFVITQSSVVPTVKTRMSVGT